MIVQPANAVTALSYINVDISGTLNPTDYPYAITDDGKDVWMTLFGQGALVKINKVTKAVQGIFNNNVGGADFYAVTPDASGSLFITERDGGRVWKYNIAGNTWTETCVTPTITHAKVTNLDCNLFRVDENPSHGFHTYDFGSEGYFSNVVGGNLYVAGSHYFDFDAQAEVVGVADVNFAGLYKVNPSDLSVTRITIDGASKPRGLSVDGAILWVTDLLANKIFKFDTTTDTVLATFTGITQPFGIDASDPSFLFVGQFNAPNIYKISKSDGTISKTEATGHSIGGVYSVFVDPSSKAVYWSGSDTGAVGYFVDGTATKQVFTTSTSSNHFMIKVGAEIWTAGRGSASIVVMPVFTPTPPVSGGGAPYNPQNVPVITLTSKGVGGASNIYRTSNGSITLAGFQWFQVGGSSGHFKCLTTDSTGACVDLPQNPSPSRGTFNGMSYQRLDEAVVQGPQPACSLIPYLWFCTFVPAPVYQIQTSTTKYGIFCNNAYIANTAKECIGNGIPVSYQPFNVTVSNLPQGQTVISLEASGTASGSQTFKANVIIHNG